MVPVVISILLVVLMSGAVLTMVASEQPKPRRTLPPTPPPRPTSVAAPPLRRLPATSRRLPPPLPPPLPPAPVAAPPAETPAAALAPTATVRLSGPPMPRHRARSGLLLIVLAVTAGVFLALVIGALVAALAFGLRTAVTS